MTVDAGFSIKRVAAPLRQEVTNGLRTAIVTSIYKPGERLIETALCERFNVSRSVVREALRQLESEGLIAIVPNHGPEVATLTIAAAQSLYEVRSALESLAGQLFAQRATDEQRDRLLRAFVEIKHGLESAGVEDRLSLKDQYYEVLFDGSGNDEIARMLKVIHARTQLLRVYSLQAPGRSEKTVAELDRITRSAIAGDSEMVRQACLAHVNSAAAAALDEMRIRLK